MLDIHFNYKQINNNNYKKLFKSIENNYSINDYTLEYPFYYIFKRGDYDNMVLNHKYLLIDLIKKNKRVGTNGRIYYSKLVYKKNKIKYDYVFVKENTIIPYNKINDYIYYKNNDNQIIVNNKLYQIPYIINSMNNPSYIHTFVSYLLSKCVEDNYIQHFPLFYGSSNIIMEKFTYSMEKDTYNCFEDNIIDDKNIKIFNYDNEDFFIELNDVPIILSYHEKINYNLIHLMNNHNLSTDEWYSFLFQIYFSLNFIQNHFKMIHNDLHIGNILYRKTNEEFLYYYVNNKYYKIPTFNRIYVIIDWERTTFEFNNILYYNNVFMTDNDCSGQYTYKTYHINNKKTKLPNCSFDITFLISSILNFYDEESNYNISNDLYKYFIDILIDKNGIIFDYNNQSFSLYEHISNNSIYGIPKNRLNDSIFKKFKVFKKNINNHIYL